MKRLISTILLSAGLVSLASAGPQPQAGVPDYLGFYGLNIPGFSWSEGSRVQVEYRRLSGTLDLTSTSHPRFLAADSMPIELTLDQTSRLLLAVTQGQTFDLVGLEGRATDATAEKLFFVVFVAVVEGRQINLIPSLTSQQTPNDGGRSPGNPGGPGAPGPRR